MSGRWIYSVLVGCLAIMSGGLSIILNIRFLTSEQDFFLFYFSVRNSPFVSSQGPSVFRGFWPVQGHCYTLVRIRRRRRCLNYDYDCLVSVSVHCSLSLRFSFLIRTPRVCLHSCKLWFWSCKLMNIQHQHKTGFQSSDRLIDRIIRSNGLFRFFFSLVENIELQLLYPLDFWQWFLRVSTSASISLMYVHFLLGCSLPKPELALTLPSSRAALILCFRFHSANCIPTL